MSPAHHCPLTTHYRTQQSPLWTKLSQLLTLQHRWLVRLKSELLRSHLKRNSKYQDLFQNFRTIANWQWWLQFMRKVFTTEKIKEKRAIWPHQGNTVFSKQLKQGLHQCKNAHLKTKENASAGVTQLLSSLSLFSTVHRPAAPVNLSLQTYPHISRFYCCSLAWRAWLLKSWNRFLRKQNIQLKIQFLIKKKDFDDIKTDVYVCTMKEVKDKYQNVHSHLTLHPEFRPNHQNLHRWVWCLWLFLLTSISSFS